MENESQFCIQHQACLMLDFLEPNVNKLGALSSLLFEQSAVDQRGAQAWGT